MKMQKNSRIWNLGDTSFRRQKLLDDYTELLQVLDRLNEETPRWDKKSQEQFHIMVLTDTNLLSETIVTEELDRRARTMTNALAKIGLCTRQRKLTSVGSKLLEINQESHEYALDNFEKRINISEKNILMLRQLFKFRIFDSEEKNSFNPFFIMLIMLAKYQYLDGNHFKQIVQNLYFEQDYVKVIRDYQRVREGAISFNKYMRDTILSIDVHNEGIEKQINQFEEQGVGFKDLFTNRKTSQSVDKYEEFYNKLLEIRKYVKRSEEPPDPLIASFVNLLRDSVVKKAFMTNAVFEIPNKSSKDAERFWNDNKENPLFALGDKKFRVELFEIFNVAKNDDLVNEYYDVTIRTFNLSGVLDFNSGIVRISSAYLNEVITFADKELLQIIKFDKYKSMEDYYTVFHDASITTLQSIGIKEEAIADLNDRIMQKYDIKDSKALDTYFDSLTETRFMDFISEKFPKDKVISILEEIRNRNDNEVYSLVTDNANIPTIFEYIVGIGWYWISEKDRPFNLLKSLNLSLDGSFLPLSHAAGGDGDIVIDYQDHLFMLEVTLMDLSNQRRNELEPVIRHATNLTVKAECKPVYTAFIANDIDSNLANIFRACSYFNLKSSYTNEVTNTGINIVSLKIDELICFLEKDVSYESVYNVLVDEFVTDEQILIEDDWRGKLYTKMIS